MSDLITLKSRATAARDQFSISKKNEDWLFTDLMSLVDFDFDRNRPKQVAEDISSNFDSINCHTIKIHNGKLIKKIKNDEVIVTEIRTLGDLNEYHKQFLLNSLEKNILSATNLAGILNLISIKVENPSKPILIQYATADENQNSVATLVFIECVSDSRIIEEFQSSESDHSFANNATNIFVHKNAHLEHIKLTDISKQSSIYHNCEVNVNGYYSNTTINLCGKTARNDLTINLDKPQSNAKLNGLYSLSEKDHCDNFTVVNHNVPECESDELYHGILDHEATGVFTGKVHVKPDAQKSNAAQMHRSMLISDYANVHAQPQLEIYADDVKCAHGATIGQIDENMQFYLQSRGIDKENARKILIRSFAMQIIERIKCVALKSVLVNSIGDRL